MTCSLGDKWPSETHNHLRRAARITQRCVRRRYREVDPGSSWNQLRTLTEHLASHAETDNLAWFTIQGWLNFLGEARYSVLDPHLHMTPWPVLVELSREPFRN